MNVVIKVVSKLVILTALAALSGCLTSGGVDNVDSPGGGDVLTITGNPPSAISVGNRYSFTPLATDPGSGTLTFSISNRPGWADFDTSTGALTGTPGMGDVGTYANITISVSNGEATASMSGFSISVSQIGTGSATLFWTAPTQNEDGSTLTNLAGYRIYYGTSSGNYSNTIEINNPGVTTFVVDNLTPATYYFAAKTINSVGMESRFSGEAIKTVN